MNVIEIAYLQQCFDYCPTTGVLRWKERPDWHFSSEKERKRWNARFAGKKAGHVERGGCRRIWLDGGLRMAHRMIWGLMTGHLPEDGVRIGHANADRDDNRWENLVER